MTYPRVFGNECRSTLALAKKGVHLHEACVVKKYVSAMEPCQKKAWPKHKVDSRTLPYVSKCRETGNSRRIAMVKRSLLIIIVALSINSLHAMEIVQVSEAEQAETWYLLSKQLFEESDRAKRNEQEALRYLTLVASQTSSKKYQARAQAMLGEMYYHGSEKVIRDDEKAFYYYQCALSLNADPFATTLAHLRLGQMYLWGHFVKENYGKALSHFNLVEEQDEFPSYKAWARFLIGEINFLGMGVLANSGVARDCFEFAARQGDDLMVQADGCWRLGELYLQGSQDVPQDVDKGYHYIHMAAQQTLNRPAQRAAYAHLAYEYWRGKRIEPDLELALKLFTWVVDQKGKQDFDQWALVRLAKLLCTKNNTVEARKYLQQAVDQTICKKAAQEARRLLASL